MLTHEAKKGVNDKQAKRNSTMHEEGSTVSVLLWCVSVVTLRAFFCICI